MPSILLVEDEQDISNIIKVQLERKGFIVEALDHGSKALTKIHEQKFDLYILDRMLPGISGLDLCKIIRASQKDNYRPILFVTALGQNSDILEGLEAGADDYVTKPFDLEVLTARVLALLRRNSSTSESPNTQQNIEFGPVRIDKDSCKVWLDNEPIGLTISEYKLLCILIEARGKVLSRKKLVSHLVGEDITVTERTVDTHVFGLRKKLKHAASFIETIRGIGYRMSFNHNENTKK